MVVEIKKNSYQITKLEGKNMKVVISNGGIHIEFKRVTDGWTSVHQSLADPIFPEEDIWLILEVLDFMFIMKNQLN